MQTVIKNLSSKINKLNKEKERAFNKWRDSNEDVELFKHYKSLVDRIDLLKDALHKVTEYMNALQSY